MEPITLIVTALVAGATAAINDSAADAVRGAYASLKSLVKRKVGDEVLVDRHEQKPDVWEKPLAERLSEARAAEDPAIVEAARRLLTLVDPQGAQVGKYNVHISGGQGNVVGDNATVHQTFNTP